MSDKNETKKPNPKDKPKIDRQEVDQSIKAKQEAIKKNQIIKK
jgi:hypothetical protein